MRIQLTPAFKAFRRTLIARSAQRLNAKRTKSAFEPEEEKELILTREEKELLCIG